MRKCLAPCICAGSPLLPEQFPFSILTVIRRRTSVGAELSSRKPDTTQGKTPPTATDPPRRVLLLESEPRLRHFWEKALTDGGFQVIVATTADDALEQATLHAPHLVFLGTGLDGSKPVQVLEALRQIRPALSVVAAGNPKRLGEQLAQVTPDKQRMIYGTEQSEDAQIAATSEHAIRLPEGGIALHEVEKSLVAQALEKTAGNQSQAARLLKITRFGLRSRMKKYGLR